MILTETGMPKRTSTALAKKHIYTENDLAMKFPRKYHDYRKGSLITTCQPGSYAAIVATMTQCEKRTKNGREYVCMKFDQESILINVLMFSGVWKVKEWSRDLYKDWVICGRVDYNETYGYSMSNIEIMVPFNEYRPRIHTIYSSIKGVSDDSLRRMVDHAVYNTDELLPMPVLNHIRTERKLVPYREALIELHHPTDALQFTMAQERVIFNDLLYFAYKYRRNADGTVYSPFGFTDESILQHFISELPFELTEDQKKAVDVMSDKALKGKRINYLLQGDVGSGKTIVAAALMIFCCTNRDFSSGIPFQACLMAPREVLAKQHYNEISGYAEKYGLKCAFLHSKMKAAERKKILSGIKSGEYSVIVGTHSVLSDAVEYNNLGLIVTDEEHLFGVTQKEQLEQKASSGVHMLSMTATPIPRTLAGAIYGNDKEIFEIKSMPKGRLRIKSCIQSDHTNTFAFMEDTIRAGHQCYVVCPAIDENENTDIFSVEEAEKLYREFFEPKGIHIGVVNGRRGTEENEKTIEAFRNGEFQILISTTVIEVGVNVPNATVIVIEQAERFGLATLHQLRGRVGRNSFQSYCVLMSQDRTNERLQTMLKTTDGFVIAEEDLKQRGTGSLIGVEQSGFDKYVDLMIRNRELYEYAVSVVREFACTGYLNRLALIYDEHMRCEEGA